MKHVGLVGLIHVYNLIFNGVKWRMKRIYDQQFDTWACLKIEGYLKREYGGTLLHLYGALYSGKPMCRYDSR